MCEIFEIRAPAEKSSDDWDANKAKLHSACACISTKALGSDCHTKRSSGLAAFAVGSIAASYNIANFLWGPVPSSELNDEELYPLTATVVIDAYRIALAVTCLLKHFIWQEFAFFYALNREDKPCQYFEEDMERAVNFVGGLTVTFKRIVDFDSPQAVQQALRDFKSRARIMVVCFDRRYQIVPFMLAAHNQNMTTAEYVYILPMIIARGYVDEQGEYLWQSSAQAGHSLKEAFSRVILLSSVCSYSTLSGRAYATMRLYLHE
ncbi:unnamed protein product [Gongylonema pulchrum]|uniref:ANF_receptor domain-containing protein n=1 Tax=Gongylonema pulchrum TaxID=637853 RepID=A0A183E110_9BILA|nr:unnamed protein product [Gongylonema pulchrum]